MLLRMIGMVAILAYLDGVLDTEEVLIVLANTVVERTWAVELGRQ